MASLNKNYKKTIDHQNKVIANLTRQVAEKNKLLTEAGEALKRIMAERDMAKQSREVENRSTKPLRALAIK